MGPAMQEVASLEQGAHMDAIRCSPEFMHVLNPEVAATREEGHTKMPPSPRGCDTAVEVQEDASGGAVQGEASCHQGGMQRQQEYLCARGWRVMCQVVPSHAHDPNAADAEAASSGGAPEGRQREQVQAESYGRLNQRPRLVFDLWMSEEELQTGADKETELQEHSTPLDASAGLEDLRKSRPGSCFSCFCGACGWVKSSGEQNVSRVNSEAERGSLAWRREAGPSS